MSETSPPSELRHCVIADDVRMIRELLARWMKELGFTTTHAACGATAIAAIQQSRPDIVITDIDMPNFSGMHLLQTLRRDPDEAISQVPVIVSSSLRDASVDRMVDHFGGSVFLSKPVSKTRFIECVQALAAGNPMASDIADRARHRISPRFRRIVSRLSEDR